MKAWLITWEWIGDHAAVVEPVVAILSARMSAKDVRRYVELLYVERTMSLTEKLALARYNKPMKPIYPAEFMRIGKEGVSWYGHITCGHNPRLEARMVNGLNVIDDDRGLEKLVWKELPAPIFPMAFLDDLSPQ